MLEKTLERPLDYKEIQPVPPKGNQSWILTGRTDAEAEALILWPSDVKNWLLGKDPNAGKDWGQEEKGTTEDEMVGWHHQLYGHEFKQPPGVVDRQGSLACYSPLGHNELDTTERLNWTVLLLFYVSVFWPRGLWNISLPTKNQTHTYALEGQVLTTGPPGKFLSLF